MNKHSKYIENKTNQILKITNYKLEIKKDDVKNFLDEIYEDGFQDGYREREKNGNLTVPKGGRFPH